MEGSGGDRRKDRRDAGSGDQWIIAGLVAMGAAVGAVFGYWLGGPEDKDGVKEVADGKSNFQQETNLERNFQMDEAEEFDAMCKVCEEYPMNAILEPCRHQCVCTGCATEIMEAGSKKCPICKKDIRKIVSVYMQ